MNVQVLGPGCANCEATVALIERVARAKGLDVTVEKVDDLPTIMGYGVVATPGIVIDGAVVHAGGRPSRNEIERLLGA